MMWSELLWETAPHADDVFRRHQASGIIHSLFYF